MLAIATRAERQARSLVFSVPRLRCMAAHDSGAQAGEIGAEPVHRRRILRHYVPSSRSGRALAVAAGVSAAAEGVTLAVAAIYFVRDVGFAPAHVGATLSVASLMALLSGPFVGRLADRWGPLRLFVLVATVRGLGLAALASATTFPVYVIAMVAATIGVRASSPLLQGLVAQHESNRTRTATMGALRGISNAGLGVGLLLAGVAVPALGPRAFPALFAASGLVVAGTGWWVQLRLGQPSPTALETPTPRREVVTGPLRNRRFLVVTLAHSVLLLHDSILFVLLPLWVVSRLDLSALVGSLLLTLNAVVTVLVQGPIAARSGTLTAARRMLLLSTVLMVLGCLAFASTSWLGGTGAGLAVLVAAVVLLTFAENTEAVASWEISLAMAPEDRRHEYLAAFGAGTSIQLLVGPLFALGWLYSGGVSGWFVLIALVLLATAAVHFSVSAGDAASPAEPGSGMRRTWRRR